MRHYFAIAERGAGRTWWLSFPGLPGVFSAADDAGLIVAQATDALDTAVESGLTLPLSVEDGAKPPADLWCRESSSSRILAIRAVRRG